MSEPITLQQVKDYLRVTGDAEDDVLESLLTASRIHVERWIGKSIVPKTITLKLDRFPAKSCGSSWDAVIDLPFPKVRSITSITYRDENGATQTFSSSAYDFTSSDDGAVLFLNPDNTWPATLEIPGAITVVYVAGPVAAADASEPVKVMLKWFTNWWSEQRLPVNIGNIVNELPQHLNSLLWMNRTFLVGADNIRSISETIAASGATSVGYDNLPLVTGLTGGGSTKLDGQDTSTGDGYAAGTAVLLTFGDAAQTWKLRAKADGEVEDTDAGLVVPDDSSTLIWVRIA